MEKKVIYIDGEPSRYFIYPDGRVVNEENGRFMKGTIRGGYRVFDFRYKGKKTSKSQHRLLAEAFIENEGNLPYVHHRNSDRLDNKLENLEWTDSSTNNLLENKKETGIDHSDQHGYDFSAERWQTFRDTIYLVSDFGRVKNCETGKIMKGKITEGGYREYCLTSDRKKKSFLAHRLVWEAFVEREIDIVNHINGDKTDNRLENLENISAKENNVKALYETRTKVYKKTARVDGEGNVIEVYDNNACAARAMGVSPQSIQYAIKKNSRSCGFFWKNID